LPALIVLFAADRFFNFQAVLPIMTPVLLIGGMTTGIFTPTEGAIAACVWAMVLGLPGTARCPGRCSSRSAWTRWRPRPRCCSSWRRPASLAGC
jgi:hypothetical protein